MLEATYNLMLRLQASWSLKSFYKFFFVISIYRGKIEATFNLINAYLVFQSWFKILKFLSHLAIKILFLLCLLSSFLWHTYILSFQAFV